MKLLLVLLSLFTFSVMQAQIAPLQPITAANASQLELIARLGRGVVNDLQWHPDQMTLAVATSTGVWLLDEHLQNMKATSITHSIDGLSWSPDGQHIATTSAIGSCITQVWRSDFSQEVFSGEKCGNAIEWNDDNRHILILGDEWTTMEVHVVDIALGRVTAFPGQEAAWSPSGDVLFTRSTNNRVFWGTPTLYSWDASTGAQISALTLPDDVGFPILWAQDDQSIMMRCGKSDDATRLC